jgi:hypothetical protein
MEKFDDSQLQFVSEEIDLNITELCVKYKMSPLSLSAVMLARLIHLNNSVKSSDDLAKLLLSIGEDILNKELDLNKELETNRLH